MIAWDSGMYSCLTKSHGKQAMQDSPGFIFYDIVIGVYL